MFRDYPELTLYQFASNTPINSIDLDGLEKQEIIADLTWVKDQVADLGVETYEGIKTLVTTNPLTTAHGIVQGLKSSVKDAGTFLGTMAEILYTKASGNDPDIDRDEYNRIAQNTGKVLLSLVHPLQYPHL